MKILFILRGRPGLGHVIPGLAIAQEFSKRGHNTHVLTYSNGSKFLKNSIWNNWEDLEINHQYFDWPGLNIYDHGLRYIAPKIKEIKPDLVILGGEYQLGLLASTFENIPFAMLFNPEIFEESNRNLSTLNLFFKFFEDCKFLLPLTELIECGYFRKFKVLKEKVLGNGHYILKHHSETAISKIKSCNNVILIANGGGINFPSYLESYSTTLQNSNAWVYQTEKMTEIALESISKLADKNDEVFLFSCLDSEKNSLLQNIYKTRCNLQVHPISIDYYRILLNSNLMISRSGAGFISDVYSVNAYAVVWTLEGHDEQIYNVKKLESKRNRVYPCHQMENFSEVIKKAFIDLKSSKFNYITENNFSHEHSENTKKLVDCLIENL